MKIKAICFHENEFKGYPMEEIDIENNSVSFKCPQCGKETILRWEFEKNGSNA